MTRSRRILFAIGSAIVVGLLRLIWATYRFKVNGDEGLQELVKSESPMVFAFWHESIWTIGWYMAALLKIGSKVTFLISPSVDGEFGVLILARFGGKAVRGSATRSGLTALRGLYRAIRREKMSPAITLDGPKGPLRYCKPGAVMIARMAGVPVVPMACAARRSWHLPSWDSHLIPKPLSKVVITVGEPYTIDAEDDEDLEAHRLDLEERVNNLLAAAEAEAQA